jgi:hypothetical protein
MKVATAQAERLIRLGNDTGQILRNTLGNATRSWKVITYMCVAMFGVGLLLFAGSAFYGVAIADTAAEREQAAAFGGLGAVTFIAVFITGAIRRTQSALSDLVQIQIAFMNFFTQISMWDGYAAMPGAEGTPDPARIEKASVQLQKRSQESMELVQKYTEDVPEDET